MPTKPATDNLVEVDNVNFAYDSRQILKGVNLDIRRGQVVAIMGLSGCGKTTLLRLIGGALLGILSPIMFAFGSGKRTPPT